MEQDVRYLLALLETPVESDKTDYKSAIAFKEEDDFSIKLVKHILGFANSGGGHIIVGFTEGIADRALKIDEKLSDEIISSYEVTRLCQYVNSILGTQDRIDLTITKVPYKNKVFPCIYVSPFKNRPYFCKRTVKLSTGDVALEEGAIYIRVPGAQTVKVAGAGDWDRLITQCVEAEYETFLKRAKDVLSIQKPKSTTEKGVLKSLLDARQRFLKRIEE
jgi:predicted HTH transcriptional regulator